MTIRFTDRYPDSAGRGEHYQIQRDTVDLGSILHTGFAESRYRLYVLCTDGVRRYLNQEYATLAEAQAAAEAYFATSGPEPLWPRSPQTARLSAGQERKTMESDERKILLRIALKAQALLDRLDTLTTDEYQRGGDHVEREALRATLGQREPCTCDRCQP